MPASTSALLRLGQTLSKTACDLRREERRMTDPGARALFEHAADDLERMSTRLMVGILS